MAYRTYSSMDMDTRQTKYKATHPLEQIGNSGYVAIATAC